MGKGREEESSRKERGEKGRGRREGRGNGRRGKGMGEKRGRICIKISIKQPPPLRSSHG